MKQLKDKSPWVTVPVGIYYILTTTLVFTPTILLVFTWHPVWWVLPALTAPAVFLLLFLVGSVFTYGNSGTGWVFDLATKWIDRFYNFRANGWSYTLTRTLAWLVTSTLAVGVLAGTNFWAVVGGVAIAVANFLLVGGRFGAGVLPGRKGRAKASTLTSDIATALLDFFSPVADYKVKPADGVAYVDENARTQNALNHILALDEVEDGVYQVHFRNDTGNTDEKLVKEMATVSSRLAWYEYRPADGDPRDGFVTIKFWTVPRVDATSNPAGMLAWVKIGETK